MAFPGYRTNTTGHLPCPSSCRCLRYCSHRELREGMHRGRSRSRSRSNSPLRYSAFREHRVTCPGTFTEQLHDDLYDMNHALARQDDPDVKLAILKHYGEIFFFAESKPSDFAMSVLKFTVRKKTLITRSILLRMNSSVHGPCLDPYHLAKTAPG